MFNRTEMAFAIIPIHPHSANADETFYVFVNIYDFIVWFSVMEFIWGMAHSMNYKYVCNHLLLLLISGERAAGHGIPIPTETHSIFFSCLV